MERDPLVRGLLLLLGTIGLIWLAGWLWEAVRHFSDILLLFFLAWLLAFVLNPMARSLKQLGVPSVFAVGAVYLSLLFLILVGSISIIPAAATQLVQLGSSLPGLAGELQARASEVQGKLMLLGVSEQQLTDFYRNLIGQAQALGTVLLSNGLSIATAILGSLLQASLVLILSFYIMLDGDRIAAVWVGALPLRYRDGATSALEQIDRTFGGFVRGTLIQTAILGCGTAAVMIAAQLPYYLVLSIVAGVAMIIPVVGPYLAMGPPVILAIILAPQSVWWVFGALFLQQFVVLNVLMPRIMGQTVGLHPLVVFAAVLVGARVGGAWGAIFSVPVAAMLHLFARAFYQRVVLQLPLYRQDEPLSPQALVPPGDFPSTVAASTGAADGSGRRTAAPPATAAPCPSAAPSPPGPLGRET